LFYSNYISVFFTLFLLISQPVQSALPGISEISIISSAENLTLSTYKYTEQYSDQVDHYILFNSATDSAVSKGGAYA